MKNIETILKIISEENIIHGKYYRNFMDSVSEEEKEDLNTLIEYYLCTGETVQSIAEAYIAFIYDIMEEQYYFAQNGRYRYSSAKEVDEYIYSDPQYMKKYMVGLSMSTYFLDSHRQYMQFYKKKIKGLHGRKWLEVGPGHGEYFFKAVELTDFEQYIGIDISDTCIDMCNSMMNIRKIPESKNVLFQKKDFLDIETWGGDFDSVIVGEVLEHVESPEKFLKKVHEITNGNSFIYVTTVVNCPQKDHIYLFSFVEEIVAMYVSCGFEIMDEIVIPTNGYSLEKAKKKRAAINVGHILRKI